MERKSELRGQHGEIMEYVDEVSVILTGNSFSNKEEVIFLGDLRWISCY